MSKRKKNKSNAPKRANQKQATPPPAARTPTRRPKVAQARTTTTKREPQNFAPMAFSKETYLWLAGSFGLIILGMLLMTGGGQPDPNVWDESIIYNWRRITLAPIMMLAGVGLAAYTIFKK